MAEVQPLVNELNQRAMGGTELMQHRLYSTVNPDLLKKFQIWHSRFRIADYDPSLYQIFYAHDLPGDPESELLKDNGWAQFHKLVFVSHWQMNLFCMHYRIPPSRCEVMLNAIDPIDVPQVKSVDKLKIGYWSTPHRGLNILYPVFDYLSQQYEHIELDVFSSFGLYGWEERDKQYEELFQQLRDHPKINYHGSVTNSEIRNYAASAHILAYPSTWMETSCLVLMEAMSAGMLCVHSNLGALFETAANWTSMYQFDEDAQRHARKFHQELETAILGYDHPTIRTRLAGQKSYADVFYNWSSRAGEWELLLQQILDNPPPVAAPKSPTFQYNG
jgi:UDP-glucose:(glucosyl)LPS alpha-1,2-glucosyltransferase